ncbi:MAG TPA: tetraacyldisaccharide 4'-kinase [Steroidobacteraceae bacterium]|jgi:tetraacyldisaccharide 4'-kinase
MKTSAHAWFNRIWYGGAPPPWWLRPFSTLFGAVSAVRRFAYARNLARSATLTCPVIVVGNLTTGGTGKTPLVCWLAEQLTERGFRPGVVTRGYGGSSRAAHLVLPTDGAAAVGEEALLLAQRARVPVAIGRSRPAAAQLLINSGCDVILSDDGLQHYALARDCEIVVVDGDRRFGNGQLLPAGPLRETEARLQGVHAVVINGGELKRDGALHMRLLATSAVAMKYGTIKPLREFSGQPVHAVAAIGNPQRFFAMLRAIGIRAIEHPLSDHARLTLEDISFADDLAVLMTEKDAVKCREIAGPHHWYVPVSVAFAPGDAEKLRGIIARSVEGRAARV